METKEYKSKHYAENREYYAKKNKRWIEDNREQYLATAKRYREAHQELVKKRQAKWEESNPVHTIWRSMKRRCFNPKCDHYPGYGGRGIVVCQRWLGEDGYKNFETDMGPRPTPKHTIDRIDNNGNYEPGNCRWATRKEQQQNRRRNVLITISGVTRCLGEWSDISGICYKTVQKRMNNGWPTEILLEPPNQKYKTIGNTGRRKTSQFPMEIRT